MTNTYNPTGAQTGTQTQAKAIQASDIKALIQKHGKATVGNQEFTLKAPSAADSNLQTIINDPSFTAKAVGTINGQAEYEVSAKGKSIKIKIEVRTIN